MNRYSEYPHLSNDQQQDDVSNANLVERRRVDDLVRCLIDEGAYFYFPYQWDVPSETRIPSADEPALIRRILLERGSVPPICINLSDCDVSKNAFDMLMEIAKMNSLSIVDLSGTNCTARQFLEFFSSFSSISNGCFANTAFGNECLVCLLSNHQVKTLAIQGSNVTARRISELAEVFQQVKIITKWSD